MKKSLQEEEPRIANNFRKRESQRLLRLTLLAVGAILVFGLGSRAVQAKGADACKATTKSASQACVAGAKSDYALALGKCANIADPVARKACQDQAKLDMKDALSECTDQSEARLAACERLGPTPYDPVINPSNFVGTVNNRFLPLTPGTSMIYTGQTAAGVESNVVTVTDNTRVILGVTCIEVHDTVYTDGVLSEDTLDWFAQDTSSNVWYFGENSMEIVDGLVVSLEGSWTAGVDGAKPGIVMEANPTLGDFYRQEFSLGNAEDLAEVTGLNESASVPADDYTGCLRTQETSPLEPDALEHKFYAAGVGLVLVVDQVTGDRLELVQITSN